MYCISVRKKCQPILIESRLKKLNESESLLLFPNLINPPNQNYLLVVSRFFILFLYNKCDYNLSSGPISVVYNSINDVIFVNI